MVLFFGWDLFPRVNYVRICIHTLHANLYFKYTLSVSALGYEKCFVSKGYHNQFKLIYLFWFKMKQTLPGFFVTRFRSAFASASFSGRFPGLVLLGCSLPLSLPFLRLPRRLRGWDNLFIPRHFQRLITGKLTGVDPGRPQKFTKKKGWSNKLTEIIR